MTPFRFFVVLSLFPVASSVKESMFLKEIMTGRCYFQPPSGIEGSCPSIVGYIMNVLEGHLDGDIKVESFSAYLESADFRAGEKGGLFWLRNYDETEATTVMLRGWTTPETTPGGAVMDGLTFCGVDLRQDCPRVSGASSAFWTGAYGKYASSIQGAVHIVLGEQNQPNLIAFLEGAIPNLNPSRITSVTVYAGDCDSENVHFIESAMDEVGITLSSFSCATDLMTFMVCQADTSAACHCLKRNDKPDEYSALLPAHDHDSIPVQNGGGVYKFLFWALFILFAFSMYTTLRQIFSGYQSIPPSEPETLQPKH